MNPILFPAALTRFGDLLIQNLRQMEGVMDGWRRLVTADQRLVSMLGVCGFHDEMTSVSDYQLIQTEPGRALVRLVLVPGTEQDDVLPYLKLINSKAGGAINFDFEIVEALPRSNRGKCRFIDQRIDVTALELRSGVLV
jgi:hypothetical protein